MYYQVVTTNLHSNRADFNSHCFRFIPTRVLSEFLFLPIWDHTNISWLKLVLLCLLFKLTSFWPQLAYNWPIFLLLGNTYFDDFSIEMSFSYWYFKFSLYTLESYKSFVGSMYCSLSELLFALFLCLLINRHS